MKPIVYLLLATIVISASGLVGLAYAAEEEVAAGGSDSLKILGKS